MTTIPASEIVNVIPSVLAAGGSALDLNMLMLTTNIRVPIGTISQFPNADAVSNFFGPSSDEAALASVYFQGFTNCLVTPGNILFAQYPELAVAAYLRGGDISALSLSALQSLTGTLIVTVDGYVHTAGSLNLSAATSFSSAASIIQTALNASLAAGGTSSAASIAGTTLTVGGTVTGTFAGGQTLVGAGVTLGTKILSQIGGAVGGAGTYLIDTTQTVASEAMTSTASAVVVTFDSVSGAFIIKSGVTGLPSTIGFATGTLSDDLLLTLVSGAVISQGAAPAVPGTFMGGITASIQNWATFMTTFNPDVSGNTNKLAFAAWTSSKKSRYAYVCTDTDLSPTTTVPATSSLGFLIADAGYSGTFLVFDPDDLNLAAFVGGIAASIDFTQTNGRTTFAFRSQEGLVPSVTDATVAANLIANGYNFYGAYATANQQFVFLQPGQVSGPFDWMDSYINQIQLNNSFQLSLVELLVNARSIPYNAAGNAQIEAALSDDINSGLNFGTFRAGVTPSSSQAVEVNAAAGVRISDVLAQRGWYLQVLTPSAEVRQARGSPVCNFWYMDGESIQKINLSSVNVQ